MTEANKNIEKKYFNKPQILSTLVRANVEVAIWGRGTGKTTGLIARRMVDLVHEMPGSAGVLLTPTFKGALENTLPPLVSGLKDLGYIEGVHFVFGRRPPKWFKMASAVPREVRHCMFWYNGTFARLVSQDRKGSANGPSIDWIIGDEAKLLNKQRIDDELMPANRGNRHKFGHCSAHHSILYCTDRLFGKNGRWIEDMCKEVDQYRIDTILALQYEVLLLQKKLRDNPDYAEATVLNISKQIKFYEKKLYQYRKKAVYVSFASALDNIEVLGLDWLEQQEQRLPKEIFRVAILNKKPRAGKDPFYPDLDRKIHCYTNYNNDYLDSFKYNFEKAKQQNCLKDADIRFNQTLYISVDPGANINTLNVGVFDPLTDQIKVVKSMYVKSPSKTKHLIKMYCNYYAPMEEKNVVYYYDHTHIGRDGKSDYTYKDIIVTELEANGWNVTAQYIGHTPTADRRYQLWGAHLTALIDGKPKVVFNEHNNEYLLISMENAQTKLFQDTFVKDKSSERDDSTPDEEATHFSDSVDNLLYGMDQYPDPIQELRSIGAVSH